MISRITRALKRYTLREFLYMSLLNKLEKAILAFNRDGLYLEETGWLKSKSEDKICDKEGNPIPWMTYSIIPILEERLTKDMKVLEYGSGNSTVFFSSRVQSIVSVEHDEQWANYVNNTIKPDNCQLLHKSLEDSSYVNIAEELNKKFDVIVIDGRRRVECCRKSMPYLTEKGIVIFDNFEREKYHEIIKDFEDKGFRQIDFWGLQPVGHTNMCTTIFYRDENCFEI